MTADAAGLKRRIEEIETQIIGLEVAEAVCERQRDIVKKMIWEAIEAHDVQDPNGRGKISPSWGCGWRWLFDALEKSLEGS